MLLCNGPRGPDWALGRSPEASPSSCCPPGRTGRRAPITGALHVALLATGSYPFKSPRVLGKIKTLFRKESLFRKRMDPIVVNLGVKL